MKITATMVKELRDKTGAGMMEAKNTLVETGGDMEKATEVLREKGLQAAAKKEGRIAAEGIVDSYIHMGGKVGVMCEVNCETDFVALTDDFKTLVHDICIQIAASKPLYVNIEDISPEEIQAERERLKAAAIEEGKPEKIIEKIVEGGINKYYSTACLMKQQYVKNPKETIENLINTYVAKIGEKISIRRFTRYEMGEGLEKRDDDFASEVLGQMGQE